MFDVDCMLWRCLCIIFCIFLSLNLSVSSTRLHEWNCAYANTVCFSFLNVSKVPWLEFYWITVLTAQLNCDWGGAEDLGCQVSWPLFCNVRQLVLWWRHVQTLDVQQRKNKDGWPLRRMLELREYPLKPVVHVNNIYKLISYLIERTY